MSHPAHYLVVSAVGAIAGVSGSLLASRYSVRPAPPVVAAAPIEPFMPPGWQLRNNERLAAVESQLASLPAVSANKAPTAPKPDSPLDAEALLQQRATEREQQYRVEIDAQSQRVAEHAREARDEAWAAGEETAMRELLAAEKGKPRFEIVRADCRQKSCVSELRFATPDDALAYLRPPLAVPAGCKGMISTPTPPRDEGSYDLTLYFNCR
jgi:hypothetical protein